MDTMISNLDTKFNKEMQDIARNIEDPGASKFVSQFQSKVSAIKKAQMAKPYNLKAVLAEQEEVVVPRSASKPVVSGRKVPKESKSHG